MQRRIRWSRAAKDRGERGDIGACLGGKRAARRAVLVIAAGAGVIGRKHRADIAVAVEHLAQIGRACKDVVARVVGIAAEAMADAQA